MKKWLILFAVIDFMFVGLVLKYSSSNERAIASLDSETELTSGQKNKMELVQSFQLDATDTMISFVSDHLQMICDTSSMIELKFQAINVAYAGEQPTIIHTYSCQEIKKDLSRQSLVTQMADFKSMQHSKKLNLGTDILTAEQIYSDETFPESWKLTELKISGPSTFTINQFEIEKIHASAFEFKVISVK
jgi:hypothetical protein